MDTVMMQVLQCFSDYILLLENAYIEQTPSENNKSYLQVSFVV